MKKIVSIVIVLTLMFSLVSCNVEKTNSKKENLAKNIIESYVIEIDNFCKAESNGDEDNMRLSIIMMETLYGQAEDSIKYDYSDLLDIMAESLECANDNDVDALKIQRKLLLEFFDKN